MQWRVHVSGIKRENPDAEDAEFIAKDVKLIGPVLVPRQPSLCS